MSFMSSHVVTQCTWDWWDMLLHEPSGSTEGEDGVGGWQTGRSFTLPASGCPENQCHRTLSVSDFTNSNTLKKCKFGYFFFMKHTFWDSCSLVHHKTNKEPKKEKKDVVNPPQLGCGVPGWFYHIMSSAGTSASSPKCGIDTASELAVVRFPLPPDVITRSQCSQSMHNRWK